MSDYVLTPVSNAASATAGYVSGAAGKARNAVTGLFSNKVTPPAETSNVRKFNWKIALKMAVVFLVITGLIWATVFSAGAVAVLVAAGVATWKAALAGTGVAMLAGSAVGGGYFAVKCKMDRDTGHNLKDTAKFIGYTIVAPVYAGMCVLAFALIWSQFYNALFS